MALLDNRILFMYTMAMDTIQYRVTTQMTYPYDVLSTGAAAVGNIPNTRAIRTDSVDCVKVITW